MGSCFYVGKGKGQRAHVLHRRENKHHSAIVNKLKSAGLVVEVRIINANLSEARAFAIEIDRIAMWRAAGIGLCNQTDGGDGCAGRKLTEESIARMRARFFSDEHRQKISAAKKGVPVPEERKARISATLTGRKSSPEAIRKTAEANRGRVVSQDVRLKIGAGNKGRVLSDEQRKAIGVRARGCIASEETRKKMSEARRGKKRGPMSEAHRQKIRDSLIGRPNMALKGKMLSEDHRKKLCEAQAKRWASQKACDTK